MHHIKALGILLVLLLFLQSLNVYSQEERVFKIDFGVYDLYDREEIKSNFAKITANLKENGSQQEFMFQNRNSSEFNISFFLNEGKWDFKVEIDDLRTPVLDYYIIHSLNVDKDITQNIYLLRVGSIKGLVKDNSGKLVSNAKVKFECERDNFIGILESDLFGTFSTRIVPEGNCKVYATYGDSVGISEIFVKQGNAHEAIVVLDQKVVFFDINNIITILSMSLAGFILLIFIFKFSKSKGNNIHEKDIRTDNPVEEIDPLNKEEKSEVEISSYEPEHKESIKNDPIQGKNEDIVEIDYSFSGEKHHLSKRSLDILNSLSNGQKKVVEFLLEEGNHSTQARISRVGKIPKSTLHRYLTDLEEKRIITKKEDFNQNKVFLTDYFLSEK
ncbi:MAG TPA: hypothetical protein PLX15_01415 [Candidatus Woesearchaeota archaeon]|nr:hypothetical protein [Candidatus Woesearchaeota archaeon]